jgi:NADH-ubiquinone oxidoreductase chain 6
MALDLFFSFPTFKGLIMILAIIAGIFVITTKNAIISVFNLIVLYILVAFYLIYIGITYLGISYIIVYIGAIAILFLFVIMMIDIEVVEKKNNNYLPLLFFLLGGFLFTLKNILYNLGILKIKSLLFKVQDKLLIEEEKGILFNINPRTQFNTSDKLISNNNIEENYTFSDITLSDKLAVKNDFLTSIGIQNSIFSRNYGRELNNEINSSFINKFDFKDTDFLVNEVSSEISNSNYLLIIPEWDSAISRVTQISAIGDVLYTVYHSYIYIVSVILLLGMVGAIILTAEHSHHTKVINIERSSSLNNDESNSLTDNLKIEIPKNSNILAPFFILNTILYQLLIILFNKIKYFKEFNRIISNFLNITIIQKVKSYG